MGAECRIHTEETPHPRSGSPHKMIAAAEKTKPADDNRAWDSIAKTRFDGD